MSVELPLLLSFLAFVALALAVAIFARRAGRVLGETRDAEGFRRAVADLTDRVEHSLGGVSERIDAVRRHQVNPPEIAPNLAAALDAVARYADEARALHPPTTFTEIRGAIVEELERADRALRMVAHGCEILADTSVRGSELEAQTSIKRGYLNVLHAREAIARHATAAAALRSPHEARSVIRRTSG